MSQGSASACAVRIVDSHIHSNVAKNNGGGGAFFHGGGSTCELDLVRTDVYSNEAAGSDAQPIRGGAGMNVGGDVSLTMKYCKVYDNSVTTTYADGGGIGTKACHRTPLDQHLTRRAPSLASFGGHRDHRRYRCPRQQRHAEVWGHQCAQRVCCSLSLRRLRERRYQCSQWFRRLRH